MNLVDMKRLALLLAVSSLPGTAAGNDPPSWVQVTDAAGWQPRDSQGELVYKDRLWIFGGWFHSFEAPPRDVWSSHDGKPWKLVEQKKPWKHSDLSMSLVFDDKMWFIGGLVQRPTPRTLGQQPGLVVEGRKELRGVKIENRLESST